MPFFVTLRAQEGGYWIRFPYDPDLIERIKRLPSHARRWNPDMSAWWVDDAWFEVAKRLLNETATFSDHTRCRNGWRPDTEEEYECWRQDEENRDRKREEQRQREQQERSDQKRWEWEDWKRRMWGDLGHSSRYRANLDCFVKLYLLPSAPPKMITAAWKALSLLHHPDVGGSTEEMKEINLAYEEGLKIATRSQ